MQNTHEEGVKVYEIAYLFVPSVPQEKVAGETATLKEMLAKAGANVIGEENPELITLAYQMTKKMHGVNHRFDEAYFGWVKFELMPSAIESVKKSLDAMENVLRHLLITTIRENTYLGKRALINSHANQDAGIITPEATATPEATIAVAPVVSASSNVEDMDKSIDAMVRGV